MGNVKAADKRLRAIQRLADVLTEENAALMRLDFHAAVAMVNAKEAALADVTAAPFILAPHTALEQRVTGLAAENQLLLERAITVQTRIVRIIAQAAAPPPAAQPYNGYGRPPNAPRAIALALSTRA